MDVFVPLPQVNPGDLLERLNTRTVSPLVLACARQYAEQRQKAQGWSDEQKAQIRRDLATYPLFEYLSLAFTVRSINASYGSRGYRESDAPLRGRISEQDATPYRAALDWFALARLIQNRTRLGICPVCKHFFVDAKHRGKTACSIKCGNTLRARKRYDTLKSKPRKYLAYKKKQAKLMRARRAAGLA